MSNNYSYSKPLQTKNSQSHDDTSSGKHPANDKAFLRCTATEILWRMWLHGYSYPMFIEPTITRVPSGFSGYIRLDTKIVLKR